jgi:protein-disulfide isomerase
MSVYRRTLLSVAIASAALPARAALDTTRAERSLGSQQARQTAIECFSLTCPHCADFAEQSFPQLTAELIATGRLRWVFYDYPTDLLALQAAMVARYLPVQRYERFIDTLFANQMRWAYAAGDDGGREELWPFAADGGMARTTFDRAVIDTGLRDWIVGRATDAESRWQVEATPSFVIDGKVYEGAMSAAEFVAILAG